MHNLESLTATAKSEIASMPDAGDRAVAATTFILCFLADSKDMGFPVHAAHVMALLSEVLSNTVNVVGIAAACANLADHGLVTLDKASGLVTLTELGTKTIDDVLPRDNPNSIGNDRPDWN